MKALSASDVTLDPPTMEQVVDFDYCTEQFVLGWLDHIGPGEADLALANKSNETNVALHSRTPAFTSDTYSAALNLAVRAPTSAPSSYYEKILARARSFEELRNLVSLFSFERIDLPIAALLARILAQEAVTAASITDTALDNRIDVRVRTAFRSLIIASNNSIGRRALLKIITADGIRASGIEMDSILAGLGFDESIALMRPHWNSLTSHHRSVAFDAIRSKATNDEERGRVEKMRAR